MTGFVIQHTPVVSSDSVHGDHSHDLVAEFVEKFALKRLGEVVRDHLFSRTVLYRNLLAGNAIGDEKITNVDVTGAFSTGGFPVLGEFDRALIILVKNRGDTVALGLHKILRP